MSSKIALFSDRESIYNYFGILKGDETRQRLAVEDLRKLLKEKSSVLTEQATVRLHLVTMLRLSQDCPLPDVRNTFRKLLEELKQSGLNVPGRAFSGPSSYIPISEMAPIDTDQEGVRSFYLEYLATMMRVPNYVQVLALHPMYLEKFARSEFFLMYGNGPLTGDLRSYIAIMASARFHCPYLVELCEMEFLRRGGNPEWLKGLAYAPNKIRSLEEINKLLAHQPWLINKDHFVKLKDADNVWSIAELAHAVVIMGHFHALASFIHGSGVTKDIDMDGGHVFAAETWAVPGANSSTPSATDDPAGGSSSTGDVRDFVRKMEEMRRGYSDADMEENLKFFEQIDSSESSPASVNETTSTGTDRYTEDPSFGYLDYFARRSRKETVEKLNVQDFSWEVHGFPVLNRLFPMMAQIIDEKFATARNLTYNSIGEELDVDTSTFRLATWNYIHFIFGIFHDDYIYKDVNKLLEIPFKQYIKTVTCYPQQTTIETFKNFFPALKDSERVHLNLLVLESKLQAELLYALRAISDYFGTSS